MSLRLQAVQAVLLQAGSIRLMAQGMVNTVARIVQHFCILGFGCEMNDVRGPENTPLSPLNISRNSTHGKTSEGP